MPYLGVCFMKGSKRTSIQSNTHNPVWNEVFPILVNSLDEMIVLELWNHHTIFDKFVGEVQLGTVRKLLLAHEEVLEAGLSASIQEELMPKKGHSPKKSLARDESVSTDHLHGLLHLDLQLMPRFLLQIEKAVGLAAMDHGSTSDPYVLIKVCSHIHRAHASAYAHLMYCFLSTPPGGASAYTEDFSEVQNASTSVGGEVLDSSKLTR